MGNIEGESPQPPIESVRNALERIAVSEDQRPIIEEGQDSQEWVEKKLKVGQYVGIYTQGVYWLINYIFYSENHGPKTY